MRSLVLGAVALAAPLAALGEPESYTVDPRHTVPAYEVTYWGMFPQQGRFDRASGTIAIDFASKRGKVEIVIDTASVSSGISTLDDVLRGEDFFDTEKYPRMIFKSERLLFDGGALTGIAGDFTMLGVTRPVTFSVTHFQCQPNPVTRRKTCAADIEGAIKRSAFGMKYAYFPVGDEVILRIALEAVRDGEGP